MLPYSSLLRIDERGHGQISFTDFEKLFGDEGVKAFFESLQIGAVDAWTLFTTLETCPKVCEQKAVQSAWANFGIYATSKVCHGERVDLSLVLET